MGDTQLNTESLFELEKLVTSFLEGRQMKCPWHLEITTTELNLRKIEEDVFYKTRPKDDKEKYVPSQDNVTLNFGENKITLKINNVQD